jgi:acetate kinase
MGFTPLEGLPMGTRSGNIDPAIISYMMEKANISSDDVNETLNKRSGVLGISGISSDFRDLTNAAEKGNDRARIALDVFNYQVEKFIGSYAAAMSGVDCIVFTAGIGENTPIIREDVCTSLEYMGIKFDKERNDSIPSKVKEGPITTDDSKISVLVIPTNEELMIARETMELI